MQKIHFSATAGEMSVHYGDGNLRLINLIADGYDKVITGLKFRRKLRGELISKLVREHGFRHYEFIAESHCLLLRDSEAVIFDEKKMAILSKTNEGLVALCSLVKQYSYDDENNTLTYFFSSRGGLQQENLSFNDFDKIIYPELYPTIDISKLREQFDSSNERILILYGEPGVGKTTFLQYLIADGFYKKVAYVKDRKTFEDSELWYELTEKDWDLIIFDDLDNILQSRSDNQHADFVSQLLSYSDGLIRRSTKIVITTNQNIQEIDPAITRRGRCFDFLVLPPLTRSQAKDAWIGLLKQSSESYDSRFGEAEMVTQAALMSEYFQIVSDYTERSYIKTGERSYSITQQLEELGIASGSRKAGFDGR